MLDQKDRPGLTTIPTNLYPKSVSVSDVPSVTTHITSDMYYMLPYLQRIHTRTRSRTRNDLVPYKEKKFCHKEELKNAAWICALTLCCQLTGWMLLDVACEPERGSRGDEASECVVIIRRVCK